MIDDLAHEVGNRYTFQEIHNHLKAPLEPPWEIIQRAGQIIGLRLRYPINSEVASALRYFHSPTTHDPKSWDVQVWVGSDSQIAEWGLRLYQCKSPLHLYVAPDVEEDSFVYHGSFEVLPRKYTRDELAKAEYLWQLKQPLSQIIYLR